MRAALLLVLAAACGGKPAPAEPEARAQPDAAPTAAQAWAALFTKDATWSLSVATDGGDAKTVACRVAKFSELEGVTSIKIACDGSWPDVGDALTGAWTMNAEGVWRDSFLEMPAAPVEETGSLPLGTEGPATYTIERRGDAWCRSESVSAMYSSDWWTLCVDARGPTEGVWGFDADDRHETTFTRAD